MEVYGKRIPWTFSSDDEKQKGPPLALTLDHLSFQTHHKQVFEREPGRPRLTMRPASPTHFSFDAHDQQVFECDPQLSPTRLSSASTISLFPPSTQNSPWTLSPLQSPLPPTPSLLYQCLASLHRQDGNVFSITISKGLVFTAAESSRIRVWRQPDCIEHGRIRTNSGNIRAIIAHNNTLFTVHKGQRIRIWTFSISPNRFRYKKITTLPTRSRYLPPFLKSQQRNDHISCIAYYHTEGLLYTAGSQDKTIKVWRLASKKCEDSFTGHDDGINAMVVDQEEGCLFSCSSDGSVKIWRISRIMHGEMSHRLVMMLRFQPSPVNALALSNTLMSSYLYSGSADGLVNYWEKEAVSGRYSHRGFLQGHRFAVLCLVAIDRMVLSGSEDTTIRVWKREEESRVHACLAVIEGHRGPVKCMAACMEMERMAMGFLVYSASLDRTVKVWRIKVFVGEEEGGDDEKRKKNGMKVDYEMSPVLSPSWVKKKLQGSY